jgi:glutathione S-transferase
MEAEGHMLVLYHHNISVCAQKVRLALAEKHIAWESRQVDLMRGEQIAPEFLAINPKGVVPAIVHDGAPVIESSVILEYLEDAFPDRPLRPAKPLDRAHMRLWIRVPDDGLHAACGTVSFAAAFAAQVKAFHGSEALEKRLARLPDQARAQRQRQLFERGIEAPFVRDAARYYDKVLSDMEKSLSDRTWLAGDAFSLAECALAPYILRLDRLGLSAMWAHRPRLADWYARVQARPSWSEAIKAFPSLGKSDYDDDLRGQKPGVWAKMQPLLAA